jgi:hypothetical protein
MTKLETLQMIGDLLTKLDVAIGSLLPGDPKHQTLLDIRLLLDDRQRTLSRQVFNENGQNFQEVAGELAAIDGDIRRTIGDIQQIDATIANATRLLNAVTSALTTLAAVA